MVVQGGGVVGVVGVVVVVVGGGVVAVVVGGGWWGERDLERAEAYNPAGGQNQWKSEYKSDFEKRR